MKNNDFVESQLRSLLVLTWYTLLLSISYVALALIFFKCYKFQLIFIRFNRNFVIFFLWILKVKYLPKLRSFSISTESRKVEQLPVRFQLSKVGTIKYPFSSPFYIVIKLILGFPPTCFRDKMAASVDSFECLIHSAPLRHDGKAWIYVSR